MKYFLSILLCLLALLFPTTSFAGTLTQVTVILDREQVATATGGTVCAQTPIADNGTEGSVRIQFPPGYTLSPNPTNWTVSTTGLPSGTTAWPGIATATSVSGQTVVFPSNDLDPATRYCFRFTGTNTLTTSSQATSSEGILTTLSGASTVIDQKPFGLPTLDSDQVAVSASVKPNATDLIATLLSQTGGTTHRNESLLSYELRYGANIPYTTALRVQVQWTLGTIEGDPMATFDMLSYVTGTATAAYNGTPPIIDPINRTITWDIASFPGGISEQSVTFTMLLKTSYQGAKKIHVTISGQTSGDGATSPISSRTEIYDPSLNPPLPPGPTSTPAPSPTPTPIPPTAITRLLLPVISDHDAQVVVGTNKPVTVAISYGTTPANLSKRITALNFALSHTLILPDLTADTQYYFHILVTDERGRRIRSDLYTFRTAKKSQQPRVDTTSIQLVSQNVILTDNPLLATSHTPTVVLPHNTPFSFYFALSGKTIAKEIHGVLTEKNVLGFPSFAPSAQANTDTVVLIPLQNGVYTGRLQTKHPGQYILLANIADYNGNRAQSPVATIKVSTPLTVRNALTHQGVENAEVTLSYYDPITHVYNLLTPKALATPNPSYTMPDGTLAIVLPQGKYKAEVAATGFDSKTVEFILGSSSDQNYPDITLTPTMFGAVLIIATIPHTLGDIWDALQTAISDFALSHRFFELLALSVLSAFLLLSLVAFQARTHIHLWDMPSWLLFHITSLQKKLKVNYIQGKVVDTATNLGVGNALVYFLDTHTNTLLAQTKTNRHGRFFAKALGISYRVRIMKEGYSTHPVIIYDRNTPEIPFFMVDPAKQYIPLARNFRLVTESLLSISYEMVLLLSLFLEISFIPSIGIEKILPFLILSLANLLLWIFQLRDRALLGS